MLAVASGALISHVFQSQSARFILGAAAAKEKKRIFDLQIMQKEHRLKSGGE
jgi:hypothetical protein